MQGVHHFQPQAPMYVDMEALIPTHHLLRKIDRQVNFSFIRQLTANCYCSNKGRPSIDPEIFFRLMLVSYLYGISSDRQLCEEVRYNLAYRWFCKLSLQEEIPEHSSLTRIRDRLGLEIFKTFFNEIIEQCRKNGLIKGERIMTDGTLIEANASLDSLLKRDPTASLIDDTVPMKSSIFSLKPRKISHDTCYSASDPDATLALKKGKARSLKYKAHLTIDADSRVILATPVTTGAVHESQVYIKDLTVLNNEQRLTIEEAIADRGYGTGEIIQHVIEQGIIPYIPLFTEKTGKVLGKRAKGFMFDEKNNRYQCPTGVYLLPYSKISEDRRITYRSRSKDCRECTLSTSCPAERMRHSHMRYIRRNIHQALFEQTIERMKLAIFADKLRERFWKIEGIISELKLRHCLGKAKYRGLEKMQIQAYLSASICNIKRLIQLFLLFVYAPCAQPRIKNCVA